MDSISHGEFQGLEGDAGLDLEELDFIQSEDFAEDDSMGESEEYGIELEAFEFA